MLKNFKLFPISQFNIFTSLSSFRLEKFTRHSHLSRVLLSESKKKKKQTYVMWPDIQTVTNLFSFLDRLCLLTHVKLLMLASVWNGRDPSYLRPWQLFTQTHSGLEPVFICAMK